MILLACDVAVAGDDSVVRAARDHARDHGVGGWHGPLDPALRVRERDALDAHRRAVRSRGGQAAGASRRPNRSALLGAEMTRYDEEDQVSTRLGR